jgi:predicted dehydrogenase
LKIGLIGCGGVSPAHLRIYKSIEGAEVVGLCDVDLKKAKNLAMNFHVEKTYADYWNMFESHKLDLVDICTPVSTHKKIVCDAAKAVPAILVEKPMAMDVRECDEMIAEVKKHNSKLCIGHNQLFFPFVQRAKHIVDSSSFKLLSFITTQKESFELLKVHNLAPAWNVSPKQRGIIWEVCCHMAYLQLHFLPDIKEVYALGSKARYPVFDNFAVLLRTSDARYGVIELSWLSRETEIIYELRDLGGRRLQMYREFNCVQENSEEPPFNVPGVARNILIEEGRVLDRWWNYGLGYIRHSKIVPSFQLICHYIESIKKDLPSPVTGEDGRRTVNLLECIEESLEERKPVECSF